MSYFITICSFFLNFNRIAARRTGGLHEMIRDSFRSQIRIPYTRDRVFLFVFEDANGGTSPCGLDGLIKVQ